jgi:hypothetical protein
MEETKRHCKITSSLAGSQVASQCHYSHRKHQNDHQFNLIFVIQFYVLRLVYVTRFVGCEVYYVMLLLELCSSLNVGRN